MKMTDIAADSLNRNLEMVKAHLADFSDADMLARPCPSANHAAWQLGHLIVSETRMVNAISPGTMPELPAGFEARFTKETASRNDAASFAPKADLLAQFARTRAGTIAWVKKLSDADIDKPTPENMQRFVPTVGHLLILMPTHVAMHIGQFQVIRRSLGRPVMF